MRLVPVNSIKEGSLLGKTIYDGEGRILLTKRAKLSKAILKRVEQNGILSLYINDEYSDNEIEDIIKPELRQKAIKALKESFSSLVRYNRYVENDVQSYEKSRSAKLRYERVDNLNNIAAELVEEILSQKDVLINLVDIKSMDNYTYAHCVNVTVLSLILGIEMALTREKLIDLAIGAMLHDVGKVFVPAEILQKNDKLTSQEFEIVKEHPSNGYTYLKDNKDISAISRIVVLQHHEKIDGTGYPDGLSGSEIYDFSKIVSVADVYDALTSDRPYRRAMPPNEAVEYIMGGANRYFDYDVVNAFVKKVVPYPIGTLVRLSNGSVGVVHEINPNYPLHPIIKLVNLSMKQVESETIDLMEQKNIVIIGIYY